MGLSTMGRPLAEADDELETAGADASCFLHPEMKIADPIRVTNKNQATVNFFILFLLKLFTHNPL
jgi:hypothetical protein